MASDEIWNCINQPYSQAHIYTMDYTYVRTKEWMPRGIIGAEGYLSGSGERVSSRTSWGLVSGAEGTFRNSYSDSLIDDPPFSSIRSVVTLIYRRASSVRLILEESF